jgi:hypothetical protein
MKRKIRQKKPELRCETPVYLISQIFEFANLSSGRE